MMNFEQVDTKITNCGYRRHAGTRMEYNDVTDTTQKVYDYEHRKKLDMFSVYTNEAGSVVCIEFTKVTFDLETRRYTQKVTTIESITELNKFLSK